jgi:predicted phage tail component-like protein
MRSKNRQLLPETNDSYVQVPGRQGSILFPRELADRRIELDCAFVEPSLADIRTKAREIAAWLNVTDRANLSFDDETGKTYKAKLASAVDFDHIGRMGEFSLSFACEPLAYGSEVTTNFANDSATVANAGTYSAPAIIEATFTDTATEFKVTLGTKYVRVVHDFVLNDTLKIDTGTGAVLINGTRAMDKLDWQNSVFFELAVGNNTLSITPTGRCTAIVKHTPRWL